MEDGRHGCPVEEAGLTGGLDGVEGPVVAEVPDWSSEARAWEGGVDHGRGREGNTGTSKVPGRPCRIKGGSRVDIFITKKFINIFKYPQPNKPCSPFFPFPAWEGAPWCAETKRGQGSPSGGAPGNRGPTDLATSLGSPLVPRFVTLDLNLICLRTCLLATLARGLSPAPGLPTP